MTCPVLAPLDAARPVAIGDDPMTTGAQTCGLRYLRSNEVCRWNYRAGLKILVSAVQSRPCPPFQSLTRPRALDEKSWCYRLAANQVFSRLANALSTL